MEHLANVLTDKLIELQIIKSEDRELYAYGFWQGSIYILNLASVAVVGLLFGMLWQSFIFTVSYGLLRPVAGGYHARLQRNCYIFSLILIIAVLCALQWLPWNSIICLVMLLLSDMVIFILAPVEDENKPLDEKEQMVYKQRTHIILLFLSAMILFFLLIGRIQLASNITISVLASAIMLILGKIKNIMRKN